VSLSMRVSKSFVDAFADLRKGTIIFVTSVFPSSRPSTLEQFGFHWRDLHEI